MTELLGSFAGNTKQMTIILNAKDNTAKAFDGMESRANKARKVVKQAFRVMKASVLAFATAILASGVFAMKKMINMSTNLIKASIKTADSFEIMRIQMRSLRGSIEEGDRAFEQLWETAKKIPFTIDEIAQSGKILEAFKVVGRDMEMAIIGVADASVLMGTNMEHAANIIGRAWGTKQIRAMGPGAALLAIMRQKLEVQEFSKVTLPEFQRALIDVLTDPQYGIAGMSEKMAQTWTGITSMIQDSVTQIKLAIAGPAEGGLFAELKDLGRTIMQWLRADEVIGKISEIGTHAGRVIRDFHEKFLDMIRSGAMMDLVGDWVANFKRWSDIARNIIANLPAIGRAVMNMVTSMGMGLQKFFDLISTLFDVLERFGLATGIETEIKNAARQIVELDNKILGIEKTMQRMSKNYQKNARESVKKLTQQKKELFDQLLALRAFREFREKGFSLELEITGLMGKQNKELDTQVDTVADLNRYMEDLQRHWNLYGEQIKTVGKYWEGVVKDFEDSTTIAIEVSKSMANAMETFFFDAVTGEFKGLQSYLFDFERALVKIAVQVATMRMMKGMFPATTPIPELSVMQHGGVVPGNTTGHIPIMAQPGEMFLNKQQQAELFKIIKGNRGGGPVYNISISAMDSQDVYRALTKDPLVVPAVIQKSKTLGGMLL